MTHISHAPFRALLARYVGAEGRVDYERWHRSEADVAALDRYLGRLAVAPPDRRPDLYPSSNARLAYWINLYNALVIREILRRWPLDSVDDVKPTASSYLIPHKGFFRDLEFRIGRSELSLDDIEHRILRGRFADARIHFAINCGSRSCPILQRDGFDAASLGRQLDRAAAAFINDPHNVTVDDDAHAIRLSKIFKWYGGDFVRFVSRRRPAARKPSVLDFLLLYADHGLAAKLRRARTRGYRLTFFDYDWSINAGHSSSEESAGDRAATGAGVGHRLPKLVVPLLGGRTWQSSSSAGKVLVIDFWATYCNPCRRSFPKLEALWEKYRGRGLEIVAISEDDAESDAKVRRFVSATGAHFPIGRDADQTIADDKLAVRALPTTLVIDRNGVLRYRHHGLDPKGEQALAREIRALLAEPTPGR